MREKGRGEERKGRGEERKEVREGSSSFVLRRKKKSRRLWWAENSCLMRRASGARSRSPAAAAAAPADQQPDKSTLTSIIQLASIVDTLRPRDDVVPEFQRVTITGEETSGVYIASGSVLLAALSQSISQSCIFRVVKT